MVQRLSQHNSLAKRISLGFKIELSFLADAYSSRSFPTIYR